MANKTKARIFAAIFISLIIFTEAGREVLMELLGMILIMGICGLAVLIPMFFVVTFTKNPYIESEEKVKAVNTYKTKR